MPGIRKPQKHQTFTPGLPTWQAATVMRSLILLAILLSSVPALAQDAPAPPAPEGQGRVVLSDTVDDVDSGLDDVEGCQPGQCCPPTTSRKLLMGVGSVAAFLVLFFLLVRLMERAFIRSERSPLLGRHVGISLALLLGGGAVCGICVVVTGCWLPAYTWVAGFLGLVWLAHLAFTMIVVRR